MVIGGDPMVFHFEWLDGTITQWKKLRTSAGRATHREETFFMIQHSAYPKKPVALLRPRHRRFLEIPSLSQSKSPPDRPTARNGCIHVVHLSAEPCLPLRYPKPASAVIFPVVKICASVASSDRSLAAIAANPASF